MSPRGFDVSASSTAADGVAPPVARVHDVLRREVARGLALAAATLPDQVRLHLVEGYGPAEVQAALYEVRRHRLLRDLSGSLCAVLQAWRADTNGPTYQLFDSRGCRPRIAATARFASEPIPSARNRVTSRS